MFQSAVVVSSLTVENRVIGADVDVARRREDFLHRQVAADFANVDVVLRARGQCRARVQIDVNRRRGRADVAVRAFEDQGAAGDRDGARAGVVQRVLVLDPQAARRVDLIEVERLGRTDLRIGAAENRERARGRDVEVVLAEDPDQPHGLRRVARIVDDLRAGGVGVERDVGRLGLRQRQLLIVGERRRERQRDVERPAGAADVARTSSA